MDAALPEFVDAWRMVQARTSYRGNLPLAALTRLKDSLASTAGQVDFNLEFGKDEIGVAHLRVRVETELPLTCQRTLDTFAFPVHLDTRLGLIDHEQDEASLPAGYEPLLVPEHGLRLVDVLEDELILALPVVPIRPGSKIDESWRGAEPADEADEVNPFTVLSTMKRTQAD